MTAEIKARASALILELGLTVDSTFIPWSQSRNAREKHPSLNWQVTIRRNGRDVLTTTYSAGSGHCPAYKASVKALGNPHSLLRDRHIRWECEHGFAAKASENPDLIRSTGKALQPDVLDVLYSLVHDADALDHKDFEGWASDLGYDPDSRAAEKIYRACLDIALALRVELGDANMQRLRDAFQDY